MVTARCNDVLSRKRTAARQLPRIMLHPSSPQGSDAANSLIANDCLQDEAGVFVIPFRGTHLTFSPSIRQPFRLEDNGNDAKKRSRDVGGKHAEFALSELSDSQSKSPVCYAKDSEKVGN
ncbi:unnamed protein product [Wuchereria bancrofti]|uniref:Uncharacterized protein n=1 Tax=Wuchereria bancrofti TaxID=6293 RepID=A0A3P7EN97_WUCBA|nr:unnamed protein product [Wuchereria bancrofti]